MTHKKRYENKKEIIKNMFYYRVLKYAELGSEYHYHGDAPRKKLFDKESGKEVGQIWYSNDYEPKFIDLDKDVWVFFRKEFNYKQSKNSLDGKQNSFELAKHLNEVTIETYGAQMYEIFEQMIIDKASKQDPDLARRIIVNNADYFGI